MRGERLNGINGLHPYLKKYRTVTTSKIKPIVKPAATRSKPATTTSVKPAAPSPKPVAAPSNVVKPKKVKLVRDSFTMPSFDYALIGALKLRALGGKAVFKKSELLRAGLHALDKLDTEQLIALVGTLTVVKTGRPKK